MNQAPRQEPPGLLDAHHPWRPEPRPADRRGDGADLRDLDLRPAEPRRAQGFRICAQPEPDALRLRARRGRPRKRHRRLRLRLGPGGDRAPCSNCSIPARISSPPTTSMAARSGCSSGCASARPVCRSSFVDFTDLAAVEAAIRPETKMLWVETPTNPLLRIVDLEGVAALAKRKGLISVADNTFCSPYHPAAAGARHRHRRPFDDQISERPFRHGRRRARSVGDNKDLADRLKFLQNAIGAISGPFDSFLALRGIKTLALRMERHSANGQKIARMAGSAATTCGASSIPASPATRSTPSPRRRCRPSAA